MDPVQKQEIDTYDMYRELNQFHVQVMEASKLGRNLALKEKPDHIYITGMGGSALAGDILQSYLGKDYNIIVNKGYHLPNYLTNHSLVFVISYSGETEETLQAYRDAMRIGCKIVAITSGAKLKDLARKQKTALIEIPGRLPPRVAYGYLFFPIINILANTGVIPDPEQDIQKTIEVLSKQEVFKKKAETLAEKLRNKTPLIYTSERMKAIGYKWKINFNENAKTHAFCNYIPEINHNEMLGFNSSLKSPYYVVILRDQDDNQRIRKRMDLTKELIRENNTEVTEILLSGHNILARIFSAIYIGDWTSYFLALEYNIDPSPVKAIEEFKKKL